MRWPTLPPFLFPFLFLCLPLVAAPDIQSPQRLRIMIETDAGGDPDDEQSLVRFLLYANEWDVQGIIANRPKARDRENLNPQRTGLRIVQTMLKAYGQCHPNLLQHDRRYPSQNYLWQRTVPGYQDTQDGVNLIIAAVDSPDPRPLWFCNWGTDDGSAPSCLKRALDQVLRDRGQAGYERFKSRLRLSSADRFADHTTTIAPPFPIWIDTLRPELDGKRWYHRFSALTATAGGFDVERHVRKNHGPLGTLYPTNTTHPQKEGDTMTFLYLVPTGMNDPDHPHWGSWAGRYGPNPAFTHRHYFWANQTDNWRGTTHRDNTLLRWAAHFQNDFRARLEWCVNDFPHANHPPIPQVKGPLSRTIRPGDTVLLDASQSTDPDKNTLAFQWIWYPEAGTYQGAPPQIRDAASPSTFLITPTVNSAQTVHIILIVTDSGSPPLARYRRLILTVDPAARP